MKADASGTLHLLYEDDTAAVLGEDIFYRRSTDGGQTFSSPLKLNAAGSFGIETALAVGTSGRIVAVWTGTQTGDTNLRIYAARSTDGGLSFSAPVAVSPNAQYALYPVAAIDPSGKILVVYYDISTGIDYVFTSRSTNGGTSFDTPLSIPETTASARTRPGLAFDSKGGAYLTYDHIPPSGTLAWASGNVEYRHTDDPLSQVYRVSLVYIKEGGEWRLVQTHFSNGAPFKAAQ